MLTPVLTRRLPWQLTSAIAAKSTTTSRSTEMHRRLSNAPDVDGDLARVAIGILSLGLTELAVSRSRQATVD
jgi:hypothetical protein